MPIYEYVCGACGHTLDALQKIADAPLRKCPECRKSSLRRVVSRVGFRLKGAGWYETDFKGDGEKKRNLVESASDGADGAPSEAVKEDSKSTSDKSADKAPKEAANGDKAPSKKRIVSRPLAAAAKKPAAKSHKRPAARAAKRPAAKARGAKAARA